MVFELIDMFAAQAWIGLSESRESSKHSCEAKRQPKHWSNVDVVIVFDVEQHVIETIVLYL